MTAQSEIQTESESYPVRNWRGNRTALGLVAGLLVIHVTLGLHAAARLSVTNDEFWHIPVGYWNLTDGRFHYDNLNPPLARSLTAVPLFLVGADRGEVPDNADKETRADAFVAANGARYESLLVLARLVPLFFSVLTACTLADWALREFGPGAAVLATAMWCLSPNVIAHASLATTDIAASLAFVVVLRCAWSFGGNTTWQWAFALGLLAGAAQLMKFTCLLLLPLCVVVWMLARWRHRQHQDDNHSARPASVIAMWCSAGIICVAAINAGYLFRGTGMSLNEYAFGSASMKSIRSWSGPFADVPLPLPQDYVEGIDRQRAMMETSHPTFLDQQIRFDGGFRDYYLKAMWYKMPHGIQLLCVLGLIGLAFGTAISTQRKLHVALLIPVVLLIGIASFSTMQLGIRYVLPVFPLLFLSVSHLASSGARRFGWQQFVCVAAVAAVLWSLRFAPFHLSYFNELAGGPENGEAHLLDSNVDWGQGLYEVRSYAAENNITDIKLAYFGAINPADLGIQFTVARHAQHPRILWPALEPGYFAVSKNFTNGRPGMVRDPDGTTRAVGPFEYGFFRHFKRHDQLGYCIDIYKLSEADIASMPPNPQ